MPEEWQPPLLNEDWLPPLLDNEVVLWGENYSVEPLIRTGSIWTALTLIGVASVCFGSGITTTKVIIFLIVVKGFWFFSRNHSKDYAVTSLRIIDSDRSVWYKEISTIESYKIGHSCGIIEITKHDNSSFKFGPLEDPFGALEKMESARN